ncbi:MAG: hypothetical protein HY023_06095 [Chloroflexi bacterium]|nr:hypothetical protein [Chloroflexota bacterium]MBI3762555.1 hypothetical protein [Chloroflexota bacterium]
MIALIADKSLTVLKCRDDRTAMIQSKDARVTILALDPSQIGLDESVWAALAESVVSGDW